MDREYDLVVYGATGFTGRLVCQHLCRAYLCNVDNPSPLRIAFAGRSLEKLEEVKSSSCCSASHSCKCASIELIKADADDRKALLEMCRKTKTVATTVGPFKKYGDALVEACVEASTHYCNITGEVDFIKDTICKYGSQAKEKKVKIVHCCGFDSVPSDISVLLLQNKAVETFGKPAKEVQLGVVDMIGSFSGGTFESMIFAMDNGQQATLSNPYFLCDAFHEVMEESREVVSVPQPKVTFSDWKENFGYVTFFVMSQVNEIVVRYSNYLQNYRYGEKFRYCEFMATPGINMITSRLLPLGMFIFFLLLKFKPTRFLLRPFLPKPGEGPSQKVRDNGHFMMRTIGIVDKEGKDEAKIEVTFGSKNGDPGYKETAKMLAECALAMSLEEEKCSKTYGVGTPAACIGPVIAERLRKQGFSIGVNQL